jgi:hypothetical protein
VTSQKQKFMAMIRRGQKLVGQDAIAAAHLGLGELYVRDNGSFGLRALSEKTEKPMEGIKHENNK